MNRLRLIFQLSATALLSLSAVMFAVAEENPLAGATVPVVIFCWLVIDRRSAAGVGPGTSVVLGLAAVTAAVAEFLHGFLNGRIEARLLAPAHLLVYLMWLFLLQRKLPRHYWMLLGLCVLQVAVASLLTNDAWFGLALVVFASLGLWTLGVFTLYRAARQVEEEGFATPNTRDGLLPSSVVGTAPPHSPAQLLFSGSTVRNAVHLDPGDRLIGAHFAGGTLVMVVLSLLASGIFFLFIPRVWITGFHIFDDSPLAASRPLTGFTEQVTLGDMGEILENGDLVMQIELFDGQSGIAIPPEQYDDILGEEPLFRGNALEVYANGRWAQDPERLWEKEWMFPPPDSGVLRQRIRMEPIGTPTLFGAGHVLTCASDGRQEAIRQTRESRLFRRFSDDADLSVPFEYDAFSATDSTKRREFRPPRDAPYLVRCARLPRGVERAVQAAHEHLRSNGVDRPRTQTEDARNLESWLRDSGEFRYSLNLSIQDPEIDPLEDFLVNRRQGHCEYFASALAVMLRGEGIPSRVISGFKGGQWNPRTGKFEVRQLHAHSWVEAFVEEGWVSLDPTPPEREVRVAELQEHTSSLWARWRERWSGLWSSGIQLSKTDQEQFVYGPLEQTFKDLWRSMQDARGTSAGLLAFFRALAESPERWFSWRGGVAVFALLGIAVGAWRIGRKFWSVLWSLRGRTLELRRAGATVDFYERFLKIVARTGLERPVAETQREFAGHVGQAMALRLQTSGLQELPADLASQFYRVRYGSQVLSDEERSAVTAQLDALERCVAENGSKFPPR